MIGTHNFIGKAIRLKNEQMDKLNLPSLVLSNKIIISAVETSFGSCLNKFSEAASHSWNDFIEPKVVTEFHVSMSIIVYNNNCSCYFVT